MKIEPTPENKGLSLTITVTAYDNGMVKVDHPLRTDWMGAVELVVGALSDLRKQSERRRRADQARPSTQ